MSGDAHSVIRALFGDAPLATTTTATAASAGPSSTTIAGPPSPPRKTVAQLEEELKDRDERIAALEALVVRLQDLVAETPSMSEAEIEEQLHQVMESSSVARRLDVGAGLFTTPPQLAIGGSSTPPTSMITPLIQPAAAPTTTTSTSTTTRQYLEGTLLPFTLDTTASPAAEPMWPSAVSSFQFSGGGSIPVDTVAFSQPSSVASTMARHVQPPIPQRTARGPPTPIPGRRSIPGMQMQPSISGSGQQQQLTAAATLDEMRGNIVQLTRYQNGCRFIQRQLDWAPDALQRAHAVSVVLDDILPTIDTVITDVFGQYLMPKIMEHANAEQRSAIIHALIPHIVHVSCSPQGSHGLQRLLAFLDDDQAGELSRTLAPAMVELSKDPKGNYIVQSFLKTFGPGQRVQAIHTAIIAHLVEISCHKVGCTVVCRAIDKASREQLCQLVSSVVDLAMVFVQDQYANYVTQHILTHCSVEFTKPLIEALRGHIAELCLQKFSSNVIEKCLAAADRPTFEWLLDEMIVEPALRSAVIDPFGNFVVQKLLDLATPEQHKRLVRVIIPLLQSVKSPYAAHIQKKLLHV